MINSEATNTLTLLTGIGEGHTLHYYSACTAFVNPDFEPTLRASHVSVSELVQPDWVRHWGGSDVGEVQTVTTSSTATLNNVLTLSFLAHLRPAFYVQIT
ncbi:hypothetical protein BaRGS_00021748 [Batillaria attramentaria]|uniref:Uncharacterized protein n=1 Tax=Batillaria attramentaria TaxID=370345 RepID=A0ABD0KIY9_9CAEN